MTIDQVNALSAADFNARFDFLFEHSPWIVAAAETRRPFASVAAMEASFADVIEEAGEDKQIALLRAHPELASKAAIAKELTDASNAEQASAGLDRLSPEDYALFHQLNDAYRARFGFPFIIAVRTTTRQGILTAMAARATNDVPAEIATARSEIAKIVHLRLKDALA